MLITHHEQSVASSRNLSLDVGKFSMKNDPHTLVNCACAHECQGSTAECPWTLCCWCVEEELCVSCVMRRPWTLFEVCFVRLCALEWRTCLSNAQNTLQILHIHSRLPFTFKPRTCKKLSPKRGIKLFHISLSFFIAVKFLFSSHFDVLSSWAELVSERKLVKESETQCRSAPLRGRSHRTFFARVQIYVSVA